MSRVQEAIAICRRPEHLRRTLRIALIVGLVLTTINQADVVIRGEATALTAVKVVLNFCVPFVVSNLGLLSREPRPARAGEPPAALSGRRPR